ncbi:glucuronate isomerase [Cellulomonas biazotea]|uniref:Uronate isomerase n=1 Tax=Cellulomonas biazotea TaxID=1709 RepID=A0A402DTQ2_9CELL|nr:glucuronate isomerase [Cellulomonas biazotea]GCE77482.1 hypothetical protein CBZ_25380 [Cellulomonas biazotea]
MEDRRAYFCAHGAVSADLSHEDDGSAPLDPADAERIYARAVAGTVTAVEAVALRRTCCSRWHACPPRTPWWFLDAPTSILRWREAVTEIVGLSRTSGFIDDTRALCSIPARHDMARRVDAGFLAGLVAAHRLDEREAADAAVDLVVGRPAEVFRLDRS